MIFRLTGKGKDQIMSNNELLIESNEFLLRRFVANVGADYKTDYSPHLWPEFSQETVELWNEIESRLKAPTCLNFDKDGFEEAVRREIEKQDNILKLGADYGTSFHYGVRGGLNLALRIAKIYIERGKL